MVNDKDNQPAKPGLFSTKKDLLVFLIAGCGGDAVDDDQVEPGGSLLGDQLIH